MLFISGPRQVGKTTTSKQVASDKFYLNWDNRNHRELINSGPDRVAEYFQITSLQEQLPLVIFDEIHKYPKWKDFLKGFFDTYGERCKIVVTGSGRLQVFKRGGDSMMGRYFTYRMHPLSLGELSHSCRDFIEIHPPAKPQPDVIKTLLTFSGFPEPFFKADKRFYNRWRKMRSEQLFKEDLRDLSHVQELSQIEILANCLNAQSGDLCNYSDLAQNVNCSVDSIRRWITLLADVHYCFIIRPWFQNVQKSLRKQPKIYLWDWALVSDSGKRKENFLASHLLKAVHWWNDIGLGEYDLHFIRDKNKREVDFLVSRDKKPWLLIECKSSGKKSISPHLRFFHETLKPENSFQVAFNMPFVNKNCFSIKGPVIVPAETLLSQLW